MIRLIFLFCFAIIAWPFARIFRKQLNIAKAKLNAAGLPATLKNMFFMEAAIVEAERKKRDALLAEFGDQIDSELEDAKASRRALAHGQQKEVGYK